MAARAGVDRRSVRLRGIILAAGAGERMGGPKAMLLVQGEPLARIHARRLKEAGCEDVVLVTRPELTAFFVREGIAVASRAADPAGSLAVGLGAMPDAEGALVVTPVDAWPVRTSTIACLAAALAAGADAATPRFGDRGGHPVVLRASVLRGFAAAPRPLRDLLAGFGARRVRVDVDDPAVATDLDSPAQFVELAGEEVRFWNGS